MKIGARNQLIGTITEVKKGSVMAIDSLEELGLRPGDEVEVVVKAVNVLLLKR